MKVFHPHLIKCQQTELKNVKSLLSSFVLLYVVIGMISGKILDKKALITNESEIFFQSTVVENLDFFLTMNNNQSKLLKK